MLLRLKPFTHAKLLTMEGYFNITRTRELVRVRNESVQSSFHKEAMKRQSGVEARKSTTGGKSSMQTGTC